MNIRFWLVAVLAIAGVVAIVALRAPADEEYVEAPEAGSKQYALQEVRVLGHSGYLFPSGNDEGVRHWGASKAQLERFEQRLSELDLPNFDGYLRRYRRSDPQILFVQLICPELQNDGISHWETTMYAPSDVGPCMVHARYDLHSDEILRVSRANPGSRVLYDYQFQRPGGGASLRPPRPASSP